MKNTRNCRLALSCILGTALLCACNMPLVTPEMVTAAKDSFGMSATVANKQVVLDWVPDPTVESYNLRFTRNGSMPSPANGEILSDVKPPLTVAGLANGNLHLFTVTATFPGGQTKEIGLVRAIPLSAATLAPQVKGQIGQIRVRWPKIAATDSFLVERRSGETGAFVNLGVVSGCEYIDRDVAEGLDYYYRIKPSAYADMASGANVARPAMALKSAYLSQALSSTDRSLDIGASGNFAYVAEGTKGFRALDIRDPANPIPLATYALPANPRLTEVTELAVSGSWLCLVGYGDLAVYKLNTGTGAATFDRFVTVAKPYAAASDQAARAVVIKGNFAYVACDSQGVQVVNLDTGAIVQYLDFGLNASVFDVAVFKDAYLAVQTYSYVGPANPSNSAVIKVYSIAANGSLVGLGASATKNLGVLNPSAHLAVAGDFLYVLAYQKWVTLSLAAPAAPVPLSTKDFAPAAMGVDLVGNRCIIFGERYGPQSAMAYEYDVADPANPVLSTSYELPYGGWAAAILDSAILVAADATGVQVVRDPRRFAAKKSFLRLAGNGELTVFDVETRGGLVALVGQSGSGGLFVLADISDSSNPRELARVASPGITRSLALSGSIAYLADETAGLRVVDISNPAAPKELRVVDVGGRASGVAVHGDMAYVTNATSRLRMVDISDPAAAFLVPETIPLLDKSCSTIVLDGSMALMFAGTNYSSLQCVDLLKPWEGAVNIPSITSNVAIDGDYAYWRGGATNAVELRVENIGDPLKPTHVASAPCPGYNWGGAMSVSGGYAFAAIWGLGIQRFSIANPSSPTYLGGFGWADSTDVVVDGSRLVAGTGYYIAGYGIEIWSLEP